STGRRCGSRHRTFRCRPPTSWKTSRCPPSTASSTACAARCRHNLADHARRSPRARSAPSPLVGEGWGGGVVRVGTLAHQSRDPHPQSLPTRGRGAHRFRGNRVDEARARRTASHEATPMSSRYDNLLANVPTDLWIGGKWRKSSDGGRFDVLEPATENKIA